MMQNNAANAPSEQWVIHVHVCEKVFDISCGNARQRLKWLGHVAIARWDEENHQGWKRLGIPTGIKTQQGGDLAMGAVIREVINNGDHIFVRTSLDPSETR